MPIDVSKMREHLFGFDTPKRVDDVFTFYYDESNNIRKLHLTNKGLNVGKACNFALAGILHKGECHSADFGPLKTSLNLQKTIKEIKLEHIGKGSFEDVLESKKLGTLLQWLLNNDFYIHYFNLNVLFWSIVDIVDSVIGHLDIPSQQFFMPRHLFIKSDLYKVIVSDESYFLEKLREFEYPNIKADKVDEFTSFLIDFVGKNSGILEDDRKYLLNKFMKGAIGAEKLFFIMDEKDHILISDFFIYYLRNVITFKNSKHVFDSEPTIEPFFNDCELLDEGKILKNYSFVESTDTMEVQLSDVIAGFLAKYFTFISNCEKCEMKNIKNSLNADQLKNLALLKALIDKSEEVSRGFFYRLASEDESLKSNYFIHDVECI